MAAFHQCEHPVRSGLDRQVQMADEFGNVPVGLDKRVTKFHRMRGGEPDAVDAVDFRGVEDEFR